MGTSSVKAEGEKPPKARLEGILYLLKDVTLEKHSHTDISEHRNINQLQLFLNLGRSEHTLPQLSDGGCDELHGEAYQVVFRTVSTKLLWPLQKKIQNDATAHTIRL